MLALGLLLLASTEGRPLFYWGSRPALVSVDAPAPSGEVAGVLELHAAPAGGGLALRFTLDRPAQRALYLSDGRPVSGRLRGTLYFDVDDDRRSGLLAGARDLRTGAELRLDVGVVSVGEDAEERRPASAVVTATLFALTPDGRQRRIWQGDDEATPRQVSVRGEWVEVLLPVAAIEGVRPGTRLILAVGEVSLDGRLKP